jgi:hypothetical protein
LIILKYVCSFEKVKHPRYHTVSNKLSIQAILSYAFIALASFLFSSPSFATPFDHQHDEVLHQDQTVNTGEQLTEESYNPLHFPLSSDHPTPGNSIPDDNEPKKEEQGVDEDSDFCSTLTFNNPSGDLRQQFHLHFLRSRQNRPGVSLIILHHSWKSFIL